MSLLEVNHSLDRRLSTSSNKGSNPGLEFDRQNFKANTNKEFSLSSEVKEILTSDPESRSAEQLLQVIRALDVIRTFADIPVTLKYHMCKVGQYEVSEQHRNLTCPGVHAFVIVISGQATLTRNFLNPFKVEPDALSMAIGHGATFGELRGVTGFLEDEVESLTSMQLLSVSTAALMSSLLRPNKIATSSGRKQNGREEEKEAEEEEAKEETERKEKEEDAEHVQFLKQVDLLKEWPCERLSSTPQHCHVQYFRRGAVIIHDSRRQNEWIVIVKSGTCQAVKQLRASAASAPKAKTQPEVKSKESSPLAQRFPHTGTASQVPRTDAGRRRDHRLLLRLPSPLGKAMAKLETLGLCDATEEEESLESDSDSDEEEEDFFVPTPQGTREETVKSATPVLNAGFSRSRYEAFSNMCRKRQYHLPPIDIVGRRSPKGRRTPSAGFLRATFAGNSQKSLKKSARHAATWGGGGGGGGSGACRGSGSCGGGGGGAISAGAKRRVGAGNKDGAIGCVGAAEKEESPVFVQITLLQEKDFFGLNTSGEFLEEDNQDVIRDSPSVSLVSRGAEVIFIRKQFILEHCSDKQFTRMRQQVQPYPAETTLQDDLATTISWNSYKKKLIRDVKKQRTRIRALGSKTY